MRRRDDQDSTLFRSKAEVAETFGVSIRTVNAWIDAGMPCYLIRGKWIGDYDEIWAWLKERYGKQENRRGTNGKAD